MIGLGIFLVAIGVFAISLEGAGTALVFFSLAGLLIRYA
jgi:hypothetical protein